MLLFPYGEIVFFQDPFKPLEVLFGLSFQPAAAFVCQQFINKKSGTHESKLSISPAEFTTRDRLVKGC
ncbi:hypothetical protein [Brevibacillus centrosporus]|uniref:hypothetical protein n=1 Tax=Brevibacillus centrosporus TaxID=54910 RepID=UPI003803A4E9